MNQDIKFRLSYALCRKPLLICFSYDYDFFQKKIKKLNRFTLFFGKTNYICK